MTIEIKENRYFIGIWFMGDGKSDWMGAAYRDNTDPADQWNLIYRFRYYETKEAWDGKDRKSWYTGTISGKSEAEVERSIHELSHKVKEMWPVSHEGRIAMLDFCAMHSDDPVENSNRLRQRDWSHVRARSSGDG
jgi:hypothetical protein